MSPADVVGYWRPNVPCDYCQIWRLDCIINESNWQSCYPCVILSRPCNLTASNIASGTQSPQDAALAGDAAAIAQNESGASPEHIAEAASASRPSSASRAYPRLPTAKVKVLEKWAHRHEDHPYPTDMERISLEETTGLTRTQVSNWFTNYRRKLKAKLQKRRSSGSLPGQQQQQHTQPIDFSRQAWETLDPLQRWRNSPPETEPANFDDISDALRSTDPLGGFGFGNTGSRPGSFSGSNPDFASPWDSSPSVGPVSDHAPHSAGSTGSRDSSFSIDSIQSGDSSFSSLSAGAARLRKYRHRRRTRKKQTPAGPDNEMLVKRRFQCTFCTDRFKTKYDWVRHEKTVHLSLETWNCPGTTASGVESLVGSTRLCAFCDVENPTWEHYGTHSPTACAPVFGGASRAFYRKDHLQQHLRLVHNIYNVSDTIQKHWRSEITHIRSRCGFCNATFTTWDDRVNHLVHEFRGGAEIRDWKGSRGFDADVEARATFAMPPYLIELDTRTQTPFSASNPQSILHHATLLTEQGGGKLESPAEDARRQIDHAKDSFAHSGIATYWEKFDFELGQWAQAKMQEGTRITDEMLQEQGLLMVYGDTDPWNQSEADHPEWLADFKQKYGIETYPSGGGGGGGGPLQAPFDIPAMVPVPDLTGHVPVVPSMEANNTDLKALSMDEFEAQLNDHLQNFLLHP